MAVAHQFPSLFIPEPVRERFQTGEQGDGFDLTKHLVSLVASFQMIIGDARTQVMNVVITDVTREPLENLWQLVPRQMGGGTALKQPIWIMMVMLILLSEIMD
jgi:hypothetical protein